MSLRPAPRCSTIQKAEPRRRSRMPRASRGTAVSWDAYLDAIDRSG